MFFLFFLFFELKFKKYINISKFFSFEAKFYVFLKIQNIIFKFFSHFSRKKLKKKLDISQKQIMEKNEDDYDFLFKICLVGTIFS